jgi:negative regulator of sigma E activity
MKQLVQIIIKVALYALGLIAASFGVSAMTSCSTSHNVVARGRTTIVSVDTTIVKHDGFVRSKNYSPYE